MHLLCFNLADKEYAVDIESVREVRRIKQITPIPKSLDFIEGVVSLRGHVVPIINLRKKLGLTAAQTGLTSAKDTSFNRVLITESNNHILGIAVDSVIGVISIDKANIEPPDEVLKKCDYLIGLGKIAKRLVLIIDIEKLLSGEEKSGILEVHKKVEIHKKQ